MNLISSQVRSGPAYSAERLVEVVCLYFLCDLSYCSPLRRVSAAQTYGKVALQHVHVLLHIFYCARYIRIICGQNAYSHILLSCLVDLLCVLQAAAQHV